MSLKDVPVSFFWEEPEGQFNFVEIGKVGKWASNSHANRGVMATKSREQIMSLIGDCRYFFAEALEKAI